MKIAIIYDSLTGNTKAIAEQIEKQVSEDELVFIGKATQQVEADLYFIGSWTDKGVSSAPIQNFLKQLKNKKIAYFGTAGFASEEYFASLCQRATSCIDSSNEVFSCFFCQGKMPLQTKEHYIKMITEHPEDQKLKVSLENFEKALSHPDETDFHNVENWAKQAIEWAKL